MRGRRYKMDGLARRLGITERDVDPAALHEGALVELEHTDDWRTAKKIALDHLAEDPDYYEKLREMER